MLNSKKYEPRLLKTFLYKFINNIIACFRPSVLPLHLLTIIITWIFVTAEIDWHYFVAVQSSYIKYLFLPAVLLGSFLPMIIPLGLYFYGDIKRNDNAMKIAGALGQAALVGLLLSFFYKAFTGRVQPEFFYPGTLIDMSHTFRFGFMRGSVFWGWPSSHTTVAFAMSTALIALFPKNRNIKILALIYPFYVGIGVATVAIHWLSDFAAGVIFGSIAGFAVGKSFLDYS